MHAPSATAPASPDRSQPLGDVHGFSSILDPTSSVHSAPRTLPRSALEALERVARGEAFARRTLLDRNLLGLPMLLAPVHDASARDFLEQDIAALARSFLAIFGCSQVEARLAVIARDSCRKFHSDNVTMRLLCTYAGPGTEWVANDDVIRENLDRVDVELEEANRSVLRHRNAVHHCTAGEILLLKGDAFEGNRGRGAVHRSPPVQARALRRLVLKLDEVVVCEPNSRPSA